MTVRGTEALATEPGHGGTPSRLPPVSAAGAKPRPSPAGPPFTHSPLHSLDTPGVLLCVSPGLDPGTQR